MDQQSIIDVAAYLRYSSENQRDGYSIEAQRNAIVDYCLKNNYNIVEWYIDEAISGRSDNREQFQNAIADAATQKFKKLIVHKLDRFARNRYDSIFYRKKLKDAGVKLESVLERIDDDNPEDVILLSVLEGMGEYYSRNLSREVIKGFKAAALAGRSTGGVFPFGITSNKETKKLEPIPALVPVIKEIFEHYYNGSSLQEISEWLISIDVKKKGKYLTTKGVYSILTNEKYTGKFTYFQYKNYKKRNTNHEPIVIENAIEPIISKSMFDKVQLKIQSVARGKYARRKKQTYLLTGLLFDGNDGIGYVGRSSHKIKNNIHYDYSYYTKIKGNKDTCKIPKLEFENNVLESIQKVVFSDDGLAQLKPKLESFLRNRKSPSQKELKDLSDEIKSIKTQLDMLLDLYLTQSINKEQYKDKKIALDERLVFYQNEINKPTSLDKFDVIDLLIAFKKIGKLLLYDEYPEFRQNIIKRVVKRIDIYEERIVITYMIPIYDTTDTFSHKCINGGAFIYLCVNFDKILFNNGIIKSNDMHNVYIEAT